MSLSSQLRLLWRRAAGNPGRTLLSLLTLTVAVGATVAIFTVVNAVLLRPLPCPESERLVLLWNAARQLGPLDDLPMSDVLHFLYQEHSRTLAGVAGFSDVAVGFTDPDNAQRVPAASVTASLFDVLRTPPRLGRPFTAEEDRPGAAPVVVLGDGLWRSRFGTDPGVVGRVVKTDRESVAIVGVTMPPGFAFPRPETALSRPMRLDPENVRLDFFGLNGVVRMADGASLEQVPGRDRGAMLSNCAARLAPGVTDLKELPSRPVCCPGHGEGVPAADRAALAASGRRHPDDVVDPAERGRVTAAHRLRQRLQPVFGPRQNASRRGGDFAPPPRDPRGWPDRSFSWRRAFGVAGGRRDAAPGAACAAAGPLRAADVAAAGG